MFGQRHDRPPTATGAIPLLEDFLEPVRAARASHGHDDEDPVPTAVLLWSVPHGLASLYLRQTIDNGLAPRALEDLVRAGVRALVAAPLPEVHQEDPQWGI
jgi:hypothetical protein